MAKVSVIVPVYNAEKTLTACLGNLVNQTLQDIEIILVNDCSKDDSLKILLDCESQFAQKVLLINLDTNVGPGGARNVALGYATGEYIGFVDSDDIVAVDMYEKLYTKAKEADYDIVDCGFYNEAQDLAIIYTSDELAGELNAYKRNELIASGGYLWSKIFKKNFLDNIDFRFREKCILEDCETLMLTFAKAKNIGNVKEILYMYKNLPTSLSKCNDVEKRFKDQSEAIEAIAKQMLTLPGYTEFQEAVEYAIVNFCVICLKDYMIQNGDIKAAKNSDRLMKIRGYMEEYVKIPLEKNKFICNKISQEDVNILKMI